MGRARATMRWCSRLQALTIKVLMGRIVRPIFLSFLAVVILFTVAVSHFGGLPAPPTGPVMLTRCEGWDRDSNLNVTSYFKRQHLFTNNEVNQLNNNNNSSNNNITSINSSPNSTFILKPDLTKLVVPSVLPNQQQDYFSIVVVISAPANFRKRNAIREHWAVEAKQSNSPVIFLLGWNDDNVTREKVTNEAAYYQDLLIADFQDSYQNLTIKTGLLMTYVTHELQDVDVKFILKVDDDAYFNIPLLFGELSTKLSHTTNFLCHAVHQVLPVRESAPDHENRKWIVPTWMYPKPRYPPYCAGTFYAFRASIAPKILQAVAEMPLVAVEDLFYTGMARERVGFGLTHLKRARPKLNMNTCFLDDKLLIMNNYLSFQDVSRYSQNNFTFLERVHCRFQQHLRHIDDD